jgi:2-polyprenyl-6-methoxyphenol hydroxylase-like FAD-dependent oxidoreductase
MTVVDVVVIGGGMAGCAAAVACRAQGLSVLLLEASHALGGVVARGDHRTLCGLAPLDASSAHLLEPLLCDQWLSFIANGQPFRQGRVWLWPTTGETCARGLQRALQHSDVQVRKGEQITALTLDGKIITSLQSAGGHSYYPRAIVDASGHGVIHQLAGRPWQAGVQWSALRCVVRLPLSPTDKMARIQVLRRAQDFLQQHAALALTPLPDDRWQLSWDIPPQVMAADVAPHLERLVQHLSGELISLSTTSAVRDAGRPASRMDIAALFACRERGLCWAAWPQELHTAHGVEWLWPNADRHGIPPEIVRETNDLPQVWTIGKGMPVSAEAASALRVTGTCLALGGAIVGPIKNYLITA